MNFLYRFYKYQEKRLPILFLIISFYPAILSSGSVASVTFSSFQVSASLLAAIAYLLHIRILDEVRDNLHDSKYHKSRPIQKGVITFKELLNIDIICVAIFVWIGAFFGQITLFISILMLTYSFIASKDFFLGRKLKSHFFIYNFINMVQIFLLQIFIYFIFNPLLTFTHLIFLHFLFTGTGSIIFEFLRKLKLPGHDGLGKDTYTYYLGFESSVYLFVILAFTNFYLYYLILQLISITKSSGYFFAYILVYLILLICAGYHLKKRSKLSDILMKIYFVSIYLTLNILLYFNITKVL